MTATNASDCSVITLASDLFTDGDVLSYKVEYKRCTETEYTDISSSITFDGSASYDITPAMLSESGSVIADGVICFKLTATYADTSTIEYAIAFPDCTIKCEIAEFLYVNPYSNIHHLYEAVHNSRTCQFCDCDKACDFYDLLRDTLDNLVANQNSPCLSC